MSNITIQTTKHIILLNILLFGNMNKSQKSQTAIQIIITLIQMISILKFDFSFIFVFFMVIFENNNK